MIIASDPRFTNQINISACSDRHVSNDEGLASWFKINPNVYTILAYCVNKKQTLSCRFKG